MSRNVTLSQLRTDIAAQCDFSTSVTGRYTTTLLNRIINQSIQRFRERISNEGMTHFLVPATGTLPAGPTASYAFQSLDLSALNPSVVRTYGIDITVAGVVVSLAHRPFQERNDFTSSPTMTGQPRAWAHFQTRSVAILPAPDTAYPYTVWYLPVLADLVQDSDTFDGVAGWEVWVMWDCVCQLIARDQYATAYTQAIAERDLAWTDIVRSATKVSSAGGANVGRDTMGQAGLWGRQPLRNISAAAGSSAGGVPALSSVTNAMLVNRSGPIALGRLSPLTGAVEDVPLPSLTSYMGKFAGGIPGLVPSGTGNTSDSLRGDGTWGNTTTAASGLAIGQLAPIASPRVLGRVAAGSGVISALLGVDVATMLPRFFGSGVGLVPAPTGALSGRALTDNGTWQTITGGGGGPTMLPAGPAGAIQYNGGSGFAGASGFTYDVASGISLFGNVNVATGSVLFGPTGLPGAGLVRFPHNSNVLVSANASGLDTSLVGWGAAAVNRLQFGQAPAGLSRINDIKHDSANGTINSTGNVQRSITNTEHLGLSAGMQLGLQQLAHAASSDKLAAWTASGFANVATGILIQASGTQLSLGSGIGPVLSASGILMAGNIDMPTGGLRATVGTGLPVTGFLRFGTQPEDVITGKSALNAGVDAQLMQWGTDGADVVTIGRNTAVAKVYNRANVEHRWLVASADKGSLDNSHLGLKPGMRLGLPQLAHIATEDKLASWTPSGFANIATGIQVQASGMKIAVGTGGPILTASGINMGGTNDIQSVRRINDAEGQKAFGNLSSAAATGIVNVNAGSGTVFHLTASVSQLLAMQPSAVHGDSVLIQNRSAATHTVYNLGTGMGAPSGEIFKLNPSGAAWVQFASGAWSLNSRVQSGGF